MKYLEYSLVLLLTISVSLAVQAQTVAYAPTNEVVTAEITDSEIEELRIDRSAISEIADYISDRTAFPFGEFGYASEHKVILNVMVDKSGEVVNYKIKESSNQVVSNAILNALSTLEKVSPVVINGLPKKQTIEMPIVFKL